MKPRKHKKYKKRKKYVATEEKEAKEKEAKQAHTQVFMDVGCGTERNPLQYEREQGELL